MILFISGSLSPLDDTGVSYKVLIVRSLELGRAGKTKMIDITYYGSNTSRLQPIRMVVAVLSTAYIMFFQYRIWTLDYPILSYLNHA